MWVRNHMEIAKLEKVTQELGANSYWLPLEQDRAGNPANIYQVTAHQIASSPHDSRVKTCQHFSLLTSMTGGRSASQTVCHWQGLVELQVSCMLWDYPIVLQPGASKTYFPILPASAKSTKIVLGRWCSPISSNLWQSHSCVQKHSLKKCQLLALAHSSACFQIRRSSVSTSRDRFDRQIWSILNYAISLLWPSAFWRRVAIRIWPRYQ